MRGFDTTQPTRVSYLPNSHTGLAIGGVDLREVRYVFQLAAHPGPAEWIAGRIFYRFFGQLLRWLLAVLALLVVAYVAYGGLAVLLGRPGGGLRVLESVLGEVVSSAKNCSAT